MVKKQEKWHKYLQVSFFFCNFAAQNQMEAIMSTMTLHIPTEQIAWFEQMVRAMGWSFTREDKADTPQEQITPAMRRRISKARKESALGETTRCNNKAEMQQFFDSL